MPTIGMLLKKKLSLFRVGNLVSTHIPPAVFPSTKSSIQAKRVFFQIKEILEPLH